MRSVGKVGWQRTRATADSRMVSLARVLVIAALAVRNCCFPIIHPIAAPNPFERAKPPVGMMTSTKTPTKDQPRPAEVPIETVVGLQNERHQKLYHEFDFKDDYGITTATSKGNKKRAEAIKKADDWFFAQLGRQCATGKRLLAAREFFQVCRKDFGWKENYGKLTSTEGGNKKREEANQKALKYVSEKFGYPPTMIERWCF